MEGSVSSIVMLRISTTHCSSNEDKQEIDTFLTRCCKAGTYRRFDSPHGSKCHTAIYLAGPNLSALLTTAQNAVLMLSSGRVKPIWLSSDDMSVASTSRKEKSSLVRPTGNRTSGNTPRG